MGIVWAGNAKDKRDRLRSTRLADWERLAAIQGVGVCFLANWQRCTAGAGGRNSISLHRGLHRCYGFADTAEIVAGLDLVISVDMAVAHLAGMLNKPVWILLYNMYDWRWGLSGNSSE